MGMVPVGRCPIFDTAHCTLVGRALRRRQNKPLRRTISSLSIQAYIRACDNAAETLFMPLASKRTCMEEGAMREKRASALSYVRESFTCACGIKSIRRIQDCVSSIKYASV